MPDKKIITGQHISAELKARAQELRQNMTPTEEILWQHLRANRLGGFHFRRQQIIERFVVDFYCHQAALVVEVDGGIHQAQEAHDRDRVLRLHELHLKVLRFTNSEVNSHLAGVLAEILETCKGKRSGENQA